MNSKTPEDAAIVWSGWNENHTKTATMGSVIHYLKEKRGEGNNQPNKREMG